jgi:tetratricopeptide (TPR) repeat protein
MRLAATVLAVVALLLTGTARAQDSADAARDHYKKATGHFAVGEFAQAAAEYEEAFKLHQDPALLFNAAQSRRLAGDNQKALVLYKNFLQLYPDSRNAPTVREQIGKLQEAVTAEEKAKTAPPTNTVEPRGVGGEPSAATPPPASPLPATTAPPPSEAAATQPATASEGPRPIYKKWWFWAAAGGVVVLAVVIPVAVIAAQPKWNNLPDQGPGPHASRLPASGPSLAVRW